jgi:hypothetical protein
MGNDDPVLPGTSRSARAYFESRLSKIKPIPLKEALGVPVCAVCGNEIPPETQPSEQEKDGVVYLCCPGCKFE